MPNAAVAAAATPAVASSKRSRKNSEDEHRSKSRKKKKSGKRRRLRDDSSSPSKTDDGSRYRRKRPEKSERRKKEPRNPRNKKKKKSKKRTSRKRRYRSLSRSSSYSSRSCSTCRSNSSSGSSSVSRSLPSKPLPKTKTGSRSRRRGSDGDSERGRSRQRKRTASYDGTRRSRYLSRSCSTCGGSSPSVSRSGKTFEEIEQQNQLQSELVVEDGRAVVEVGIDEDSNRITQAYDDFDRYDGRRLDDHQQFLEMHERDDWTFAKDCKLVGLTNPDKQTIGNADVGEADVALKKSDHDSGGLKSQDLETQLRQKALENFKKFQRTLSGNTRYPVHHEDESQQTKCHSIAQDDLGNMRILERQCSMQRDVWLSKSRVRSVVKLPDEEDTSGHTLKQPYSNEGSGDVNNSGLDMPNKSQKNLVQLKRIKETSNETSLNTSSMEEEQKKNIDSKLMHRISNVDNLNQSSQQQISPLPSKPNLHGGNENKQDTGSQFQEKTFSRMHEGEVVQVSYKVYIPNKTPALARRQLQR